jgi:hypothetical protein
MRRTATIIAGACIGAFAGLFGSFAFFSWYDPNPRVATQDGMGYGLLIVFVIMPACGIGLAFLFARLTRPK